MTVTERKRGYNSNPFTTSALEGDWLLAPPFCRCSPGKYPVPIVQEAGLAQGVSECVRKFSPPPGFDPRSVQPTASVHADKIIPGCPELVCTYYSCCSQRKCWPCEVSVKKALHLSIVVVFVVIVVMRNSSSNILHIFCYRPSRRAGNTETSWRESSGLILDLCVYFMKCRLSSGSAEEFRLAILMTSLRQVIRLLCRQHSRTSLV